MILFYTVERVDSKYSQLLNRSLDVAVVVVAAVVVTVDDGVIMPGR